MQLDSEGKHAKRRWQLSTGSPTVLSYPAEKSDGHGSEAVAEFVTIEKGLGPDGRIAVVRFDRGDGINALSPEALRQLDQRRAQF